MSKAAAIDHKLRSLPDSDQTSVLRVMDLLIPPGPHRRLLNSSHPNQTRSGIAQYRRMTGEQRLASALELHEMSCDIARERMRRQHPEADAPQAEASNLPALNE